VQVYPALGNHDTWPVDQLPNPPDNNWLLSKIAQFWQDWLPDETVQKTLLYGGYYTTVVVPGLRIVSLNTLYYDSHNIVDEGSDPAQQWAWFESVLAMAKTNGEKVWILAHIYPGNGEAIDSYSVNFQNLFAVYNQTIIGNFFGHSHKDQFGLFRNPNSTDHEVLGMMYIAPSVTPQSIMNPSARVYIYDRDTFEILDYQQYHVDLKQANKEGTMNWTLLYTASSAFNIGDMSFYSWENLAQRLQNDEVAWNSYWTIYNGNITQKCNDKCRQEILCAINYVNPDDLKNCQDSYSNAKDSENEF